MSKKVPTAIAALGPDTSKGKRKIKQELRAEVASPIPPEWLAAPARHIWDQIAPEAVRIGLLTKIDINALGRYCVHMSEWLECYEFKKANGSDMITRDEAGNVTGVVPFPQQKRMREIDALLLRFEGEFGFTPSSRSRLSVAAPPQEDDLNEFESGPPLRIAK